MRQVDLQISFLLIRKNGSQCPISHHLACRWWLQKPKQESGLSWSVLLSATVLFTELIEEWECFGFWGDSLANTSRVFILEFIGFILMTLRRKKKSLVKWEGKKKKSPNLPKTSFIPFVFQLSQRSAVACRGMCVNAWCTQWGWPHRFQPYVRPTCWITMKSGRPTTEPPSFYCVCVCVLLLRCVFTF